MSTHVSVTGNLTREPEIRYTREGVATVQLGVAVNRRWQDRESHEWEESTSFFDVICWRDLAEHVAMSLSKGSRVMVSGRLEQRTWESELGERRTKVEIVADEVGPSLRFATAEVQRSERSAHDGPLPTDEDRDDLESLAVPDVAMSAPAGLPAPLEFAASVALPKDDVFEICGALALAEAVLRRCGRPLEAARMGEVFSLAEASLAG